ncbi:MAG TPA: AMP-binding protein, partial [Mycobacteriales bacterium]|nr:AMP-binding protein [Mycobacteriales bacterium]
MQEYSSPLAVEVDRSAALPDAVRGRAASRPEAISFRRRSASGWEPVTAKQFCAEVDAIAKGLIAAGVQAGDRVGLMSKTRYEWTLCDYAIWTTGAVTVPVYETSSAEQVQWNLGDSGAVAAFLETEHHQSTLKSVLDQLPDLKSSWGFDAGDLEGLKASGAGVSDEELTARRETLDSGSLATIIYTSGTTGRPKGCELSHGQLLYTGRSAAAVLPELFNPQGSTLLFLPLA